MKKISRRSIATVISLCMVLMSIMSVTALVSDDTAPCPADPGVTAESITDEVPAGTEPDTEVPELTEEAAAEEVVPPAEEPVSGQSDTQAAETPAAQEPAPAAESPAPSQQSAVKAPLLAAGGPLKGPNPTSVNITFRMVDAANTSQTLTGASFSLSSGGTVTSGTKSFATQNTYTLTPNATPSGYQPFTGTISISVSKQGDVTVNGGSNVTYSGSTVTIKYTKIPGTKVDLKLIDSDSGNPVRGASFALYGSTNGMKNSTPMTGCSALTSRPNGSILPTDLRLQAGTYYLTETSPRTNYTGFTGDVCIVVTNAASNAVSVSGSGDPSLSYASGTYTVTIENEHRDLPAIPAAPAGAGEAANTPAVVSLQKRIDSLADNPGCEDMEDMYRLYLDLDTEVEPLDVLLVIDQSGSMKFDMEGDPPKIYNPTYVDNPDYDPDNTRQINLLNFLDGTENSDGSYAGDGFIHDFLSANEDNRLAILTFSSDCSESRLVRDWDDTGRRDKLYRRL